MTPSGVTATVIGAVTTAYHNSSPVATEGGRLNRHDETTDPPSTLGEAFDIEQAQRQKDRNSKRMIDRANHYRKDE